MQSVGQHASEVRCTSEGELLVANQSLRHLLDGNKSKLAASLLVTNQSLRHLGKSRLGRANSQAVQQTPSSEGHVSNHALHGIRLMFICLVRLCTEGGGAALIVFLISCPWLDHGQVDLLMPQVMPSRHAPVWTPRSRVSFLINSLARAHARARTPRMGRTSPSPC